MLPKIQSPYRRAAIWATIIIGAALVMLWLSRLIWPSSASPNVLALVLGIPGFLVLVPGVLITSFFRIIAYMLIHHAEAPTNSADVYVVVDSVGIHFSLPFVCALVVDWILYFLIARQVLKARSQRQAISNPPPSRS